MKDERIYTELTSEGKLVCALAGLIEELAVFLALRIQIGTCPVAVLLFLWFLFSVLTAAALIEADELRISHNVSCEGGADVL